MENAPARTHRLKKHLAKPGIEPRTSIIGICCVPASTQLNLQHGLQLSCIKMKSDIVRILRAGVSVQSTVYPALVSATTRLKRDYYKEVLSFNRTTCHMPCMFKDI